MAGPTLKRSPLTAATVTPPSIDRNNPFDGLNQRVDKNKRSPSASSSSASSFSSYSSTNASAATAVLTDVARRAASPARTSPAMASLQAHNPPSMPERRTSWEDCRRQRDGYVSFPDFDQEYAAAHGETVDASEQGS